MKNIRFLTPALAVATLSLVLFLTPAYAQEKNNLSDAEVASVAVVANQIDIDYAEIAKKRSVNADVLKFAETMKNDHTAVIGQAAALVKKLGVTPKDNTLSQKLLADAKKMKASLNSSPAKSFDRAYIDNEVAYHKSVIGAVESLLIPETENMELKQLLQNVLPALRTHLEHAVMLQSKIAKK
jgi:putative membrane protein